MSIVQGLLDGGAVQDVIGLVTGLLQANALGQVVSIVQGLLDGGAVQQVIGLVTGLLQSNALGQVVSIVQGLLDGGAVQQVTSLLTSLLQTGAVDDVVSIINGLVDAGALNQVIKVVGQLISGNLLDQATTVVQALLTHVDAASPLFGQVLSLAHNLVDSGHLDLSTLPPSVAAAVLAQAPASVPAWRRRPNSRQHPAHPMDPLTRPLTRRHRRQPRLRQPSLPQQASRVTAPSHGLVLRSSFWR